jgi:RsiW-degrading membrane proteinase PrsW (M82 family)
MLSPRLKKIILIAGAAWAGLVGLPPALGYWCVVIGTLGESVPDAVRTGLAGLLAVLLTVGVGIVFVWHAQSSLQGKPSSPLRLPGAWLMWAAIFAMSMIGASGISAANFAPGLFSPPLLVAMAAIPPLLALAWFAGGESGGLTWRRGLTAMAAGATLGVALAVALEGLIAAVVLALVAGLADVALPGVDILFDAMAGNNIARALTNPGLVFVFIQLALIAPLAEEAVKPLVVLPVIGRLARRDAFLVAAMAGAGFAMLENVVYVAAGLPLWAGILLVRAAGGAIQPLGAGLVGLGWRDVLRGEPQAGRKWAARYGAAVGLHALWNGGALLIIALGGAHFFGEMSPPVLMGGALPPQLDSLGLWTAGATLALVVVLGLFAAWLGRAVARQSTAPEQPASGAPLVLADRSVAIWALACLAAIVPAGIAALRLVMR